MGTDKRERQKANRALKHQQIEQQASRRKTLRWVVIGVGAVAAVFLVAWVASTFVGDDDPATPTDTVSPIVVDPATPDVAVTLPSSTPATTGG